MIGGMYIDKLSIINIFLRSFDILLKQHIYYCYLFFIFGQNLWGGGLLLEVCQSHLAYLANMGFVRLHMRTTMWLSINQTWKWLTNPTNSNYVREWRRLDMEIPPKRKTKSTRSWFENLHIYNPILYVLTVFFKTPLTSLYHTPFSYC